MELTELHRWNPHNNQSFHFFLATKYLDFVKYQPLLGREVWSEEEEKKMEVRRKRKRWRCGVRRNRTKKKEGWSEEGRD